MKAINGSILLLLGTSRPSHPSAISRCHGLFVPTPPAHRSDAASMHRRPVHRRDPFDAARRICRPPYERRTMIQSGHGGGEEDGGIANVVDDRDDDGDDDDDGGSFASLHVMVNGMPGPMATAAAEACLRKGMKLAPVAMTGPNVESTVVVVHDDVTGRSSSVRLVPATDDGKIEISASLAGMRASFGTENLLVIDYTHPNAVNDNAIFYAENRLPFVMGTTGGDRARLMDDVSSRGAFAVIAPNMGKQIVAMQAGLEYAASKFPGSFAGYGLDVTESHQSTKADTSGTARAVISSLLKLTDDDFDVAEGGGDINMLRDDESSLAFGVSREALGGHAFHTYRLTSSDGSVVFELKHNVEGRTVYAEGTADAVKFLANMVSTGMEGRVFSMIDVLEAGALE